MDSKLSNGLRKLIFAYARIGSSTLAFVVGVILSLPSTSHAAPEKTVDQQIAAKLQAAQNPQLQICLPAIDALGRSKNSAVVKPLADAFARETRPVVRRAIVDALGILQNRAALPALKQALHDPDAQIRQSAVAALGLIGTAEAQRILAANADQENDPAVKSNLIHQLGFSATPEARNVLKNYKNDRDPKIQGMAKHALGEDKQEQR